RRSGRSGGVGGAAPPARRTAVRRSPPASGPSSHPARPRRATSPASRASLAPPGGRSSAWRSQRRPPLLACGSDSEGRRAGEAEGRREAAEQAPLVLRERPEQEQQRAVGHAP